MSRVVAFVLALALAACVHARPDAAIDAVARDYVRLALEIDTHEEGYVDAYTGPPQWREAARAHPRSREALAAETTRLIDRLASADIASLDAMGQRRVAFLLAQLRSARFRLDMIGGVRQPFRDEAERLFALRPVVAPLASYDQYLREIERLAPGEGPLHERAEAFRQRYAIPADRLDAVIRAAIAECRARTMAHIALPPNERFTLEFVTDKPWAGYNYYQGDAHSVIQINTDLPVTIDRAIDLGCHEGYPGHHTHQTLLEEALVKQRGWIEFTVFPLYSPLALIAEGAGNAGIDLAFPDAEQERFAAETLFPLAGLDPATAPDYFSYVRTLEGLSGAGITIAQMYLDGEIDRARAVALLQHYTLRSPARAEQQVRFMDAYRSYVINYVIGEEMVRAHVEAAGADPEARWAAFARVISEPTLPRDLQ